MTFFLVGSSWRRREPDGFGVWVARLGDTSPAVECNRIPGGDFNQNCACCYLGHSHSRELHDRNLSEYTLLHPPAAGEASQQEA